MSDEKRPAARPKAKARYGDSDRPAGRSARPAATATAQAARSEAAAPEPATTASTTALLDAPAESTPPAKTPVAQVSPAPVASDDVAAVNAPAEVAPTLPKAKPKPRHEAKETARPPRTAPDWLKRPATIYVALVAAAAIFAGYALIAWLTAGNESASFSRARDAVLLDARQDIVILNRLDYRSVDAGLKNWLAASTGDLHDQLANVTADDKKDIVAAKKTSDGKVIDAAVTELDNRAGTATVIATVETTVEPNDGTPPKRNRFSAAMQRVGSTWKLSALQQVEVNLS
jgi:Mce-associated membrane protein